MAQHDWPRWTHASISTYLKQVAAGVSLPMVIDGVDERTSTFMGATDRAEVRIVGPVSKETSNGYYLLFLDIHVLFTSRFDGPKKNAYSMLKFIGVFQEALDSSIGIWNYGVESGDYVIGAPATQQFLGCFSPRMGQEVSVLNYGQVDPTSKVKQAEVSCKYLMEIAN